MSSGVTFVKNAAANVARGGASSLVALVVPYFLTRSLPSEKYGAWALALQLSAYVNYLDLGIQTALARFLAQCLVRNDNDRRDRIIISAGALLAGVMLIALMGLAILCYLLPCIYPQLGPNLIGELRVCILCVGGSLAVGLPASLSTGILIGRQRNEIPALAIGGCKVLAAATMVIAASYSTNLGVLAGFTAAYNLASYVIQLVSAKRISGNLRMSWSLLDRCIMREFVTYCASLSASSIGMFLVAGLDLALVARFDFPGVAPYSAASTLLLFVTGINGSLFSALLAPTAVLHARQRFRQIGEVVVQTTRLSVFLNLSIGLPLIIFGGRLLKFWVGAEYAAAGTLVLQLLTIANVVRLAFNPFFVAVLGTGQQRHIVLSPLMEGLVNLVASLAAGAMWGAIGIAVGTFIGAIFGFAWAYYYNLPRTPQIQMTQPEFLKESLVRPLLCFTPIAAAVVFTRLFHSSAPWPLTYFAIGCTLLLTFKCGNLTFRMN